MIDALLFAFLVIWLVGGLFWLVFRALVRAATKK